MAGITRRILSLLLLTIFFSIVMLITSSAPKVQEWREPLRQTFDIPKWPSGGGVGGLNEGYTFKEPANSLSSAPAPLPAVDSSLLTGHAIAPKLGNETIKAELGRASWKLFHTVLARFPEAPTTEESDALKSYIHLFQRLYPCGECAEHFGLLLKRFPPQTSSRSVAAVWGCHIHNEVNKRLKKPIFDCNQIGDFYQCGCEGAEDGEGKDKAAGESKGKREEKARGEMTRAEKTGSSILAGVEAV